jgi:hypothetical protein
VLFAGWSRLGADRPWGSLEHLERLSKGVEVDRARLERSEDFRVF